MEGGAATNVEISPIPDSRSAYGEYMDRVIAFIRARNQRIRD